MYQSINFCQFCDAFKKSGRDNNFTYEGKKVLFEYLERYEQDLDEKIELDIIALCCDYTEYNDLEELQGSYPDIESISELEDHTTVIMIDDTSFIIQNY